MPIEFETLGKCLFFVNCPKTNTRFLIDSGAAVSTLRPQVGSRLPTVISTDVRLTAANGLPITYYGRASVVVDLGLSNRFLWTFHIADTQYDIIGADFLDAFGLLFALKNKQLIESYSRDHAPETT